MFESLDESDILGPHGAFVHEAACAFAGSDAQDEARSQACAELLVRHVLPSALLSFDGEWLKADAESCTKLKGQALADHLSGLYSRVRELAAVARYLADYERGYSNAKRADERMNGSIWGGVAAALLAGARGSPSELVMVPAAEIVRLLVAARLYDLVDAEDLAASSEDAFVPWSSPPMPQLSTAQSRYAPFAEQDEQLLSRLSAFIVEELLR